MAPAVCVGSIQLTYGELLKRVERTARLLLALSCRPQDRVALWSENGVFFVVSYLAVIRAGMVAVPLPTDCLPQTAIRIAKEAGIRTILVSTRHQKEVSRWASDTEVAMLSEADIAGSSEILNEPLPDIDLGEDLAALMFTLWIHRRAEGCDGDPSQHRVQHS